MSESESGVELLLMGCALFAVAVVLGLVAVIVGVLMIVPLSAASTPVVAPPTPPPPRGALDALDHNAYTWTRFTSGFDNPVQIVSANDGSGRLFGVEQTGLIWIINADGTQRDEPFLDVSLLLSADVMRGSYTERGLLGLAFHPDYARNGTFFIHHTDIDGDTAIARYRVSDADPQRADPTSRTLILSVDQPFHDHNGGQIAFGHDGYLYIGLGDGGSADDPDNNAQNLTSLLGKILRIDVDANTYAIPRDNPFVGRADAAPEVWAYGLRNPYRFSFDRLTGDLYLGDVGQWSMEEINYQRAGVGGANYGWRDYEGSLLRSTPAPNWTPTLPIAEYAHSEGCAVTGGIAYRGAAHPDLYGVYFYGDYCNGRIWIARQNDAGAWESRLWTLTERQITAFGEDEAGELYLADYKGDLLRLDAR
ncbi:MAG: PQQ-dependent sugar dehydrogenase [Chloroflexota bacterium]|nr:PQQ-dependent sugar dehydrogenase [Chloroflexota bacterium]